MQLPAHYGHYRCATVRQDCCRSDCRRIAPNTFIGSAVLAGPAEVARCPPLKHLPVVRTPYYTLVHAYVVGSSEPCGAVRMPCWTVGREFDGQGILLLSDFERFFVQKLSDLPVSTRPPLPVAHVAAIKVPPARMLRTTCCASVRTPWALAMRPTFGKRHHHPSVLHVTVGPRPRSLDTARPSI